MTKMDHLIFHESTKRMAAAGDPESTFLMMEKAANHVKVTLLVGLPVVSPVLPLLDSARAHSRRSAT
jgi:hypothetical protein